MASFFALSVAQFPKKSDGTTSWQLHQVSGYLCEFLGRFASSIFFVNTHIVGLSFLVSVSFIVLAFSANQIVGLWKGLWKGLWNKSTWTSLSEMRTLQTRPRKWMRNWGRRPSEHDRDEDEETDEGEKEPKVS